MNPWYKEYSDFLKEHFSGKVQKISIDLSLGCPNRDGTIGRGGCIYCNNAAFSPDADKAGLAVEEQLRRGKAFFARKYPEMRYLAYFQSYTGTYAKHDILLAAYSQALADSETVGIVIGTRPDCLPDVLLEKLADLQRNSGKQIFIEFGVESMHDATLSRINRGHSASVAADAIRRTAAAGFSVGVHLILGLPGETEEMMLDTTRQISKLPVDCVKFHQLQILKGTPLAKMYAEGEIDDLKLFMPDDYALLCARLIKHLRSDIAIDRFVAQAPADLLIAPKWGLKNYQFTAILHKILEQDSAMH